MAEAKKEQTKEEAIDKMVDTFQVLHRDLRSGAFADKITRENVSIMLWYLVSSD